MFAVLPSGPVDREVEVRVRAALVAVVVGRIAVDEAVGHHEVDGVGGERQPGADELLRRVRGGRGAAGGGAQAQGQGQRGKGKTGMQFHGQVQVKGRGLSPARARAG